jgi:hypothetical protein
VGVYLQTWASTFLKGCLIITLLPCRASIQRVVVGLLWTLKSHSSGSVELLWTLKSHSLVLLIFFGYWRVTLLGQSEDQAEMSPLWVNQKIKLRGFPIFISTSLSSSLDVLHLLVISFMIPFYSIPFW